MRMLMTWFGKGLILGLMLLGRKGTALPGLIIEKLYPEYLTKMLDQLPQGVIIITGTNGKTTTTKVVAALLRNTGLRVLTNPSGGNFVRGIIAAIANRATLSGTLPYDIAVFEQDEAHAVLFAEQYQPEGVVALNVMRDQMDRFGEIDTTAKLIGKLVASAKSWVVLNANDKRIAALAAHAQGRTVAWFGHTKKLQPLFIDDDQLYSDKPVFYEAAIPTVELTDVSGRELSFDMLNAKCKVATELGGTHNAINATAALTTLITALPGADIETALKRLSYVHPAFGRGEIAHAKGSELHLLLVKNPAGFRHALNSVKSEQFASVGIAINDAYADGRDVSWLWDVDFTSLKDQHQIVTGGTRAADMAVRLKYDGVTTAAIEPNLERFIETLTADHHTKAIIFCTYTAMIALRKILKRYDKRLREDGI